MPPVGSTGVDSVCPPQPLPSKTTIPIAVTQPFEPQCVLMAISPHRDSILHGSKLLVGKFASRAILRMDDSRSRKWKRLQGGYSGHIGRECPVVCRSRCGRDRGRGRAELTKNHNRYQRLGTWGGLWHFRPNALVASEVTPPLHHSTTPPCPIALGLGM